MGDDIYVSVANNIDNIIRKLYDIDDKIRIKQQEIIDIEMIVRVKNG